MNPNQKNIQAVLDLSSAADVAEGLAWYRTANTAAFELSVRYKITAVTACGVIAALSPRNKWNRNLVDAENLINVFCTAGADACADVKVCTFGKNKEKALAILASDSCNLDSIEKILSGPKLKEFFRCIVGQDDVCIDGHAYSIWFGDRITLNKVPSIGVKLRRTIKEDYLAVAHANSMTGFEVQAITWVCHRRLHSVA
jgi:hypothetical protein